ncbi:hypothetical protein BH09ACT4_BH09ACT4_03340 [soil metagenome]
MKIIRRFWAPVVAVLAIVIGIVITQSNQASFGWFSSAPESATVFFPIFVSPQFIGGAAVAIFGVALLGGSVGYRLAKRP